MELLFTNKSAKTVPLGLFWLDEVIFLFLFIYVHNNYVFKSCLFQILCFFLVLVLVLGCGAGGAAVERWRGPCFWYVGE